MALVVAPVVALVAGNQKPANKLPVEAAPARDSQLRVIGIILIASNVDKESKEVKLCAKMKPEMVFRGRNWQPS